MPPIVEPIRESKRSVRDLERQIHTNLLESAVDFTGQFVDPNEALFDDGDFFVPLGAWEQVPWTIDSHKRGEVLPVYLTEQGLKLIRDVSRKQAARNPFAINALRNRVSYCVGSGMVPRVMKAEDNCPDVLVKAVQAVLDEFIQYADWGEIQREIVHRSDRDGEAILRWFPQMDGTTACRFVEPEHCRAPDGRNDRRFSFGVETRDWDVEDVQAYWIVGNPDTATADQRIPATEIQHFKLNVDRTAKRGLPTLYPIRTNLERAEKLLRNMSLMAQVQATFALIKKYKGYSPASIAAATADDVDVTITGPTRIKNIRQYQPGSVIDAPENVDYTFPGGTVNAAAFVEVLQAELRAIASMLVMPEFMLSSDASNANYASTMVAESPAVKNFLGLQNYYKRKFGDGRFTPKEARNISSLWRVVRNAVRAGRLPKAALFLVKLQLEAPSLSVRDKLQEAQRNQLLKMNRILSPQTWSQQDDLDYEQEQQNFEEDDERSGGRANPLPLPGQDGDGGGRGLKLPTPESLSEGKGAGGRERASDGRFGKVAGSHSGGKNKGSGKKNANNHAKAKAKAKAKGNSSNSAGKPSLASQFGKATVQRLVKAGASIGHFEHVAKEWVSSTAAANVAKLPSKLQTAVKGTWLAVRLGGKVAFATYTAGQAAAEAVAKRRGATPEQAARLRAVLSTIDIAAAKPVFLGLEMTAGPGAAGVSSMIPLGSAAYLAYSTVRDPVAVFKTAKDGVKAAAAKLGIGKSSKSPKVGESVGLGAGKQKFLDQLYDYLQTDEHVATYLAALDHTGDVNKALTVAKRVKE